MMKKALSWQQFLRSGFDDSDYNFPDFEGSLEAEIVCKRWDKRNKLVAYLNSDDGKKIITAAWKNTNYMGLHHIPIGSRIRATFQRSKNGISYLRDVEVI